MRFRNMLAAIPVAALALAGPTGAAAATPTDLTPASGSTAPDTQAGVTGLVGCPAGRWVQVAWFIHPLWPEGHWYIADQPWIHINWRWFSGGPIPYWQGSFQGRGRIDVPPSPFTSIEFWCTVDTNIQVV